MSESEIKQTIKESLSRLAAEHQIEKHDIRVKVYLEEKEKVAFCVMNKTQGIVKADTATVLNLTSVLDKLKIGVINSYLKNSLLDFREELESENVDFRLFLRKDEDDKEEVAAYLFNDKKAVREIMLNEIL